MLSSILQFSKVSPLFYNLKKSFEKILLLKKLSNVAFLLVIFLDFGTKFSAERFDGNEFRFRPKFRFLSVSVVH